MIGRTFFHYIGVICGLDKPETQTTEAERAMLRVHVAGCSRIVEIGVFEGFTTRMLAEASDDDAVVFGVDPFYAGRLGTSWGLWIARFFNRSYLATGKVKLVCTLSTDVGEEVPVPVDYVFIDGDHTLEGITADWEFWSARVRPNGIIALHDTLLQSGKRDAVELGSHKYFDAYIRHDRRFRVVGQVDSLSILRRC
jgi:predicted O-methyltransferase YrrM